MKIHPTLYKLKNELGGNYRIVPIDLEPCLYRNFGNGFDVEISNVNYNAGRKIKATLYLWFTGDGYPYMVKALTEVERTANAITSAVDELYELSQKLIVAGQNNRRSLIEFRESEF